MDYTFIGAGLAIGFAWLWVAIWQWILVFKSMEMIGKNPSMSTYYLTVSILWIALVESSAIYWLIVAFRILWIDWLDSFAAIWAWLWVGLAWLWVWIWEWKAVWSALEAMNKDPDNKNKIMTFMVLFIALVESAAIYGLVVSFKILDWGSWLMAIWAGLAIWLAWLWVGIWEWTVSEKAMLVIWRTPKNRSFYLTVTILWIALVESAAIYGLVIAFQILWSEISNWMIAIWAWLAIGLTGLWAWFWEWNLVWGSLMSMDRNPSNRNKTLAFMVLFLALIEVIAIYGLIIALKVLG